MTGPDPTKLKWTKASPSVGTGACVELAPAGEMVAIRDSKNPQTYFLFGQSLVYALILSAKLSKYDELVIKCK